MRSRSLPRWSRPSGFAARLAAVAAAALAVRVVYALTLATHDNLTSVNTGDRYFFVAGAKLLAAGHGFVHPFLWDAAHVNAPTAGHPPLWIFALALLSKLGLLTYTGARVAGAVAGAATVFVLGRLAARAAGERAGLVAALFAAVYVPWILSDTSGLSEGLYLLLVAVGLALTIRTRESGRLAPLIGTGLAIGLAALTRTEGLLLLPLLVWPMLWRHGLRRLAVVTAAAVVVVAPWTIRNAVSLHSFIPISTNEETVIAGANCHEAYYGRDAGSWVPACLHAATGRFALTSYREGELAGRWRRAGLHYAEHHLARLPAVGVLRVLRTWRLWQPLREGRLTEGENIGVAKVGALMFLILLLPIGLLGLWRRRSWPWLALCLAPTLTSAIGWGTPRFLRPAELALMLAASAYVATRGSSSGARPSRPT